MLCNLCNRVMSTKGAGYEQKKNKMEIMNSFIASIVNVHIVEIENI